nr:lactate racemase domain-containing protein [uncultured Desulfobacter sp.]
MNNTIKTPLFKLPETAFQRSLPRMRRVRQCFNVPPAICVSRTIDDQWAGLDTDSMNLAGAKIAVAVGSRGITNIAEIVRQIVTKLKSCGAQPFIVPAMGSHGNATADGQVQVLSHLGVTEEAMGVKIHADTDVVHVGEADGIPLYMSRPARDADGIVLINRVKPHTDFSGPVESGTLKMLVIGLGNQKGADYYHRMAVDRGMYEIIVTAGRALIEKTNVLFGVQIVENQHHDICDLRITPGRNLEQRETELLCTARKCLPGLPLDKVDFLIVDQMGKNFTGAGLDPNVVGFSSMRLAQQKSQVKICRVFVRGLSPESQGNASGIGMVDVATPQLLNQIDWQATAINGFTACSPEDCKMPMTVPTEKEAVLLGLATIRPYTDRDLRLVHIKNTLELDEMYLSSGCFSELKTEVETLSEPLTMHFNQSGDLEYI